MVAETDAAEDRPLPSDAAKGAAKHFARSTRGLPSTPRSRSLAAENEGATLCQVWNAEPPRACSTSARESAAEPGAASSARRTLSAKAHISLEAEPQVNLNSTHRARDLAA